MTPPTKSQWLTTAEVDFLLMKNELHLLHSRAEADGGSFSLEHCWSRWLMREEKMVNHTLVFNAYAQKMAQHFCLHLIGKASHAAKPTLVGMCELSARIKLGTIMQSPTAVKDPALNSVKDSRLPREYPRDTVQG